MSFLKVLNLEHEYTERARERGERERVYTCHAAKIFEERYIQKLLMPTRGGKIP